MYIHNYIFAEEVVFTAVNLLFVLAVSRGNYCNYRGFYDKKKMAVNRLAVATLLLTN